MARLWSGLGLLLLAPGLLAQPILNLDDYVLPKAQQRTQTQDEDLPNLDDYALPKEQQRRPTTEVPRSSKATFLILGSQTVTLLPEEVTSIPVRGRYQGRYFDQAQLIGRFVAQTQDVGRLVFTRLVANDGQIYAFEGVSDPLPIQGTARDPNRQALQRQVEYERKTLNEYMAQQSRLNQTNFYINQALRTLQANQNRVLQQWQRNQRNPYLSPSPYPPIYPSYPGLGSGAGTITDLYNPASRVSQAQALLDAYEQDLQQPSALPISQLFPGQTLRVTLDAE